MLAYLPLLACPIGMGLMMWMMMRMNGNSKQPEQQPPMSSAQQAEFDELRMDLAQLRAANRGKDVRH